MASQDKESSRSFLGTGWSFPPEFLRGAGQVLMISEEEDIRSSLKILFGTVLGERFLHPRYGLDMHDLLFESLSTTMENLLKDRIKTAILTYEPRINLLALTVDTTRQLEGKLQIILEYEVRATNSRFNMVYPFFIAKRQGASG